MKAYAGQMCTSVSRKLKQTLYNGLFFLKQKPKLSPKRNLGAYLCASGWEDHDEHTKRNCSEKNGRWKYLKYYMGVHLTNMNTHIHTHTHTATVSGC